MSKRKSLFIILCLILCFSLAFPVLAQDYNPLRKFVRGVVNVSLGFIEIPRQMIKVKQDSGDLAGLFWGSLKGMTFMIGRALVGVYEVSTFLLPPYLPLVEPEFIFQQE